jgi:hypothetical protein
MEADEIKRTAKEAKVTAKSVEKALALGVADNDIPLLFNLRWSARITGVFGEKTYDYQPSVDGTVGLYKLAEGDFAEMNLVVGEFDINAKEKREKLETEYDDDMMSSDWFRSELKTTFAQTVADHFDSKIEAQASAASAERGTNIDEEKRRIYKTHGILVDIMTESTRNRLKGKLLDFVNRSQRADVNSAVNKAIMDDPEAVFRTINRYRLRPAQAIIFFEIEPQLDSILGLDSIEGADYQLGIGTMYKQAARKGFSTLIKLSGIESLKSEQNSELILAKALIAWRKEIQNSKYIDIMSSRYLVEKSLFKLVKETYSEETVNKLVEEATRKTALKYLGLHEENKTD